MAVTGELASPGVYLRLIFTHQEKTETRVHPGFTVDQFLELQLNFLASRHKAVCLYTDRSFTAQQHITSHSRPLSLSFSFFLSALMLSAVSHLSALAHWDMIFLRGFHVVSGNRCIKSHKLLPNHCDVLLCISQKLFCLIKILLLLMCLFFTVTLSLTGFWLVLREQCIAPLHSRIFTISLICHLITAVAQIPKRSLLLQNVFSLFCSRLKTLTFAQLIGCIITEKLHPSSWVYSGTNIFLLVHSWSGLAQMMESAPQAH